MLEAWRPPSRTSLGVNTGGRAMLRQTSAQPGGSLRGAWSLFLPCLCVPTEVTEGRPPTEVANGHPPGTLGETGGGPPGFTAAAPQHLRWGDSPGAHRGTDSERRVCTQRRVLPAREGALKLQLGRARKHAGDGSLVKRTTAALARVRGAPGAASPQTGSKSGLMAAGGRGACPRLRAPVWEKPSGRRVAATAGEQALPLGWTLL